VPKKPQNRPFYSHILLAFLLSYLILSFNGKHSCFKLLPVTILDCNLNKHIVWVCCFDRIYLAIFKMCDFLQNLVTLLSSFARPKGPQPLAVDKFSCFFQLPSAARSAGSCAIQRSTLRFFIDRLAILIILYNISSNPQQFSISLNYRFFW
jgi:hypothetical protein